MYIKARIKSFGVMMLLLCFLMMFMLIGQGAASQMSSENSSKLDLPIIMYHSILKDKNLQNDYTITPTQFENDLKYLNENGYTTVTINDIINYVYSDKELPQRCIMLTFDDGYYNNYYYAFPLLKKYKCKAVISPIVSITESFTDTQNISVTYGNMGVPELKEMIDSGLVEIQNHSYDMHTLTPRNGAGQKKGESLEEYTRILTADITKAQDYIKENLGVTPNCFVYPFGAKSDNTLQIIRNLGFICTLTCTEEPNAITKDPESLYELGRYRRDSKESMEALLRRIQSQ